MRRQLAFTGVLLTALVIPIENIVVLPIVGSLGRLAGLIMVATALPSFFGRTVLVLRRPTITHYLLAVFTFWAFAGLLWSADPESTVRYVATFGQIFLFLLIVWQASPTDSHRKAIQQAYVLGCMISIMDGVGNFLIGREAVYQRFAVSNTDPNDYALAIALAIPMAYELFATGRSWTRIANLLFVPAALVAVVLSASRGGTLAVAVAMLAFPLGWRRLRLSDRRTIQLLLLAMLAAVPFAWSEIRTAVGSNVERISTVGDEIAAGSLNERELIWSMGMDAFAARPILGVGGGAFAAAIERDAGLRQLAHNTFISVAVETGPIGLTIFLAVLLTTVGPLLTGANARTMPAIIMFATLLIGILPLTWEFKKPLWLVLSILLLLRRVELHRFVAVKRTANTPTSSTPTSALGLDGTL